MTDRVTVGDLVFYVKGKGILESAEIAVERYVAATGPSEVDAYEVDVDRNGKHWRCAVFRKTKYVARSIDVAEFRAKERAS